jgi:hypothetical protein
MKTTLELPDTLVQDAQAVASRIGLPLEAFVAQAIRSKLADGSDTPSKPWMKHFGALRHLHSESERIADIISNEFECIDTQAWQLPLKHSNMACPS